VPLPIGDTIGILADNLRLRHSVLPVPSRRAIGWARGLDLPQGGETVLYTGLMFQLTPYIEAMVKTQERVGDSRLAGLTGFGRRVNRIVNLSALMARPPAAARARYNQILIDVVRLLQGAGIDFGYLYKDDLYSGALAYDLGLDGIVARHAQYVYAAFRRNGVKNVITVDPHTTNMLRSVYPTLVDGYDLHVESYLEVLARRRQRPRTQIEGEVAFHDSCVFARHESVVQEPRVLLADTGITIKEPAHTGRLTWCCGGPAESLYPKKALSNAGRRVAELRHAASDGVTMCPLCLVNLRRAAGDTMRFQDISHYLCQAYLSEEKAS